MSTTTGEPGHPATPDEVDFFDPATQEDWYPSYDLLREEAPIWRMPGTNVYVLTRFDDIQTVLRRTDLYLRGATEDTPSKGMTSRTLNIYAEKGWPRVSYLAIDPPVHRRYRELVDPFFSVAGAERRRALIEKVVDELLDDVIDRGECEFVQDFAIPLPVRVITTMMGFELEDIPQLKVWSEAWVLPFRGGLTEEEEIYAGERGVEFQHHIKKTIDEKREHPDDSVISYLANEAQLRRRAPAHRRRDHQHGRPPLHRRQRDHDVRADVGRVAPPHPPRDQGGTARRPLEGEELRRGGPAARVTDDGDGALLLARQRAGRRVPPEGVEPAPPVRGRQPRPADLRGPGRARRRPVQRRAGTWPSPRARPTAPAPGSHAWSRTSPSARSSTGCPISSWCRAATTSPTTRTSRCGR